MKLAITIEGKTFVPVAAVPYITKGKVTEKLLVGMLIGAAYDLEGEDSVEFRVYRLLPLGDIQIAISATRSELIAVADAYYRDGRLPLDKVAHLLVSEEALRGQMRTPAFRALSPEDGITTEKEPELNLEPDVPWNVAVQLWARLPLRPDFSVGRKNGRDAMTERIDTAMSRALQSLAGAGVVLDRRDLPGRKTDWQRILEFHDSKIAIAKDTLARYFKDLDIKFRRGAKGADALAVLQHFGLRPA